MSLKKLFRKQIDKHFATDHALREKHVINDFCWFLPTGLAPLVVASFAIYPHSWIWLLIYLGYMWLIFAPHELGFLCVYCPYYRQEKGLTVKCKSLWGPSKVLRPKIGPMTKVDQVFFWIASFIATFFPMYWLVQEIDLLVLYWLTWLIMIWTLAKYECNQCLHFHCPGNIVPEEKREEYLRTHGKDLGRSV